MNTNFLAGAGGNPQTGGVPQDGWIINSALGETLNSKLFAGSDIDFISNLVGGAVGMLFIIGGISFFFMFVLGAISWILSGGDKGHVEAAKGKVTNALVGLIIMISVFAITVVLETFFGIKILSIDIEPLFIR